MKQNARSRSAILIAFALLMYCATSAFSQTDSCDVYDYCETAFDIQIDEADNPFVCFTSCTYNASPESGLDLCGIQAYPSVWFKVTFGDGNLFNIQVESEEMERPVIAVYASSNGCSELIPVALTPSNLPCVLGSNHEAEAFGTFILHQGPYYIVVSDAGGAVGEFDICINTVSTESLCVTNKEATISKRSFSGPLTGPYYPGERISVCYEVLNYTAGNNGCQWFQGVIPVFGSGWSVNSFDTNGQPFNATINEMEFGQIENGNYGTSTWDWFTDVDYHHVDVYRELGDFDGNGFLDLCHQLYDPDCPETGGLKAACCNPCWGSPPGDFLPGGWFAYGIDGSCPGSGPPVARDWGDGNTCGSGMGPWRFCFDVTIDKHIVCNNRNMAHPNITFHTFSDGETGAWTGGASLCALDEPLKFRVPVNCVEREELPSEQLGVICAGDSILYQIGHPDIDQWIWSIAPEGYITSGTAESPNDKEILFGSNDAITENSEVTIYFTGFDADAERIVTKELHMTIAPQAIITMPMVVKACTNVPVPVILTPTSVSGGTPPLSFLWTPTGETNDSLILYPPYTGYRHQLQVTDAAGCVEDFQVLLDIRLCLGDTIRPTDDDNEDPKPDDPPITGGNIEDIPLQDFFKNPPPQTVLSDSGPAITLMPNPAQNELILLLRDHQGTAEHITFYTGLGIPVYRIDPEGNALLRQRIDISDWEPGVYYAVLKTQHGPVVHRMLKLSK